MSEQFGSLALLRGSLAELSTRQVKHKRVSHIFSGHNSRNIAHINFKFVLITRDRLLPEISSFISIKSTFSTSRNCRNSFKFCKMCKILVSKTHFMKNIGFLLGWNTLYYILNRCTYPLQVISRQSLHARSRDIEVEFYCFIVWWCFTRRLMTVRAASSNNYTRPRHRETLRSPVLLFQRKLSGV